MSEIQHIRPDAAGERRQAADEGGLLMRTAFSLIPFCFAPLMTATSQLQPCRTMTNALRSVPPISCRSGSHSPPCLMDEN